MHVRRSVLAAAAVLAGVTGIALVVLGWWFQDWEYISDWTDPTGWWGALIRGSAVLVISRSGFKLALVAVVAAVGLFAWIRTRTSKAVSTSEAGNADQSPAGDH